MLVTGTHSSEGERYPEGYYEGGQTNKKNQKVKKTGEGDHFN